MPSPRGTEASSRGLGAPPLPRGDRAVSQETVGLVSASSRRVDKCATLAEWIDAGDTSPHTGLTSQISLLMLRSASLPNGYGFEFDRALGRVVLRHAAGVVIHGQALLVECDDVEFDAELAYHYCSWKEFCQLVSSSESLPARVWKHWRTTRREPASFPKGPEEVAASLGSCAPTSELQEVSCCIPLHQAPPLGSSSVPSESSDVELHFAGLGPAPTPQDIRGAAQAQETLQKKLLAAESQDLHEENWAEIRHRLMEKSEHGGRRAGHGEEEKALQRLPHAAEVFLLSAMLRWRSLTLDSGWQDTGWELNLKQVLRIWLRKMKTGQGSCGMKVAFYERDGSRDTPEASATITDGRWLLTASGREPVRTEKLLADSDEWLWLQLVRCGSGGKCKLHAGSGPSTDRGECGVIGVSVATKKPLRVALQNSIPSCTTTVELSHSGQLDPEMHGSQDIVSIMTAVDLKDLSGMSVLMHAARAGNLPATAALLAAKAYVHARDSNLCTALHYASHEGHVEVAEALLASGGSPFARNCLGVTPRDVAQLRWATKIPGQGEAFEMDTPSGQGVERGRRILEAFKTWRRPDGKK